MSYRLVVRTGGRVDRDRFDALAPALDALEARAAELAAGVDRRPVDLKLRRFEPRDLVVARLELSAPRVRAGLDVRGDGSTQAYTGRFRRRLVERRGGESAVDALRRTLDE